MSWAPETILHPATFDHSAPPWSDSKVDWSWFQLAFGDTKIKPMDIDGLIERRGHFLILESKGPGVEVPRGQLITFERMHKLGTVSVLFVWGKIKPVKYKLWRELNSGGKCDSQNIDCTPEDLTRIVRNWRSYAEDHPIW